MIVTASAASLREILRDGDVAEFLFGRQERLDRHRIGDLAHADLVGGDRVDLRCSGS
jgi:hypothetical protein